MKFSDHMRQKKKKKDLGGHLTLDNLSVHLFIGQFSRYKLLVSAPSVF